MNPRATIYSVQKITTLQKVNDATAKNLLTKIAEQVRPIMEKRKWTVGSLEEFFPPNPNLLGVNINRGQKIQIRLRPQEDQNTFLPWESLLGTMLHELTHIVQGPHDEKFYKILDELTNECELLLATNPVNFNGVTPFSGEGRKLGGRNYPSNSPINDIRIQKLGNPTNGSYILGGNGNHKSLSPREMAALAATKRYEDNIWCEVLQIVALEEMKEREKFENNYQEPNQNQNIFHNHNNHNWQNEIQTITSTPKGRIEGEEGIPDWVIEGEEIEIQKQIEREIERERNRNREKELEDIEIQLQIEREIQIQRERDRERDRERERQRDGRSRNDRTEIQNTTFPIDYYFPPKPKVDPLIEEWTCHICTLVNFLPCLQCLACLTPKQEIVALD